MIGTRDARSDRRAAFGDRLRSIRPLARWREDYGVTSEPKPKRTITKRLHHSREVLGAGVGRLERGPLARMALKRRSAWWRLCSLVGGECGPEARAPTCGGWRWRPAWVDGVLCLLVLALGVWGECGPEARAPTCGGWRWRPAWVDGVALLVGVCARWLAVNAGRRPALQLA